MYSTPQQNGKHPTDMNWAWDSEIFAIRKCHGMTKTGWWFEPL